MPLVILGLLLLICLLAYSIVRYINSGEEDKRPVRERYPHAFISRTTSQSSQSPSSENQSDPSPSVDPTLEASAEHSVQGDDPSPDDPIIFPTSNLDEEKRKRNIQS